MCTYPDLMNDKQFPEDVKKKAADILKGCGGHSVGLYQIFMFQMSAFLYVFRIYGLTFTGGYNTVEKFNSTH